MPDLTEILRAEIAETGRLTFARFMALALYHPTLGYYAGGGVGHEPIGWSGDFFTSGDVHPLWGEALTRQFVEMWDALGRPARFDVVELGAGRGLLARDVWRYALDREPEFATALHYSLIDRAPAESPLREARESRLAEALATVGAPENRTAWADSLASVAGEVGITGVLFSNELVDALPVNIVEVRGGSLYEVYVTVDVRSGRLVEALGEPSSPKVAAYLDDYGIPWRAYPDGWRAEISLEAGPWLRETAAALRSGYLLTIDYGALANELYTPERLRGTLAAYVQHQMSERPLASPGRQDLTAHVNFSALLQAGQEAELTLAGRTSQADFLRRLGIAEEAEALGRRLYPAADTERHTDRGQADLLRRRGLQGAVATLLNPHGLGGFVVLCQARQAPPRVLSGFGAPEGVTSDAKPQTPHR